MTEIVAVVQFGCNRNIDNDESFGIVSSESNAACSFSTSFRLLDNKGKESINYPEFVMYCPWNRRKPCLIMKKKATNRKRKTALSLKDLPGTLLMCAGSFLKIEECFRAARCCKENRGLRALLDSVVKAEVWFKG